MVGPVGVLALQGDWRAHGEALQRIARPWRPVRDEADLDGLGGLVLPGGESTTMLRLIELANLRRPLDTAVQSGIPVLATCAGVVLAAREIVGMSQASFGWLDVSVRRNGWGRQTHSFVDQGRTFIRAPRIQQVGPHTEVLETVRGEPALVRQGALYGATFHPELGPDSSLIHTVFGTPS